MKRITQADWDAARKQWPGVELVEYIPQRSVFTTRMQEQIWDLKQQVADLKLSHGRTPAEKLRTARRLIDEALAELP